MRDAPLFPLTVEPAPCTTALLRAAAQQWPDRIAVDFLGGTLTYRELAEQVDAAAAVLAAAGVGRGDRVGVVLPNCPQHIVAFYAITSLGAVVAEHNPLAAPVELRAQLAKHGAKVMVVWEKSLESVFPGGDTGGRQVLAVDLTAGMPLRNRLLLRLPFKAARAQRDKLRAAVPTGIGSWDVAVRAARAARKDVPGAGAALAVREDPCPEDHAVLMPTGGTTGTPKLVPLTHANLMANVAMGQQWVPGLRKGEETFGGVLPFFHAFGMTLCLTFAVHMGATQLVLPTFDADMVLAATKRRPLTFLAGVPPMFDRLERTAKAKDPERLRGIRYAISGAMSLDPAIAERWEAITGGLIIEGYGMTEAAPILLGNVVGEGRRPGSLGLPFPDTMVRIVDPEAFEQDPDAPDVPDGQVGELLAKGRQVFAGYLDAPEESAEVLVDGWLRTGDLVRRDPETGIITLEDRRKELIVTGGFNVYPSQVEDAVREMPQVADVAVVGMPGGSVGEHVVAALVLEPGAHVEVEAVREWLEGKVSRYALPRAVHIVEELPRSQLGKVLRRSVRDRLLALRDGEHQATDGSPERPAE